MESFLDCSGSEGVIPPAEAVFLNKARFNFIEETYPTLFGEEMGDPAREFTPDQITALLVEYEHHLAKNDLLKGPESDMRYLDPE